MSAKYVVEEDKVIFGEMDDDEESFDEHGDLNYVVVNEVCATAGWDQNDVVCRTSEKKEAERIAELLTTHGLSK